MNDTLEFAVVALGCLLVGIPAWALVFAPESVSLGMIGDVGFWIAVAVGFGFLFFGFWVGQRAGFGGE